MFRIRQDAIRVAVIFIALVLPTAAWSQSTLNFPRGFSPADLGLAGFAIVNPGPANAQVTFHLYDATGQMIAQSPQTIPAGGQIAKLGLGPTGLFPQPPAAAGWVQATSATTGLQGFWLGGDFTTFTDGAAAAGSAADLIFPLVPAQTELNIANPGGSSVTATLRLFGANGVEIASPVTQVLTAHGFLQGQVSSLFPGASLAQATHVRASCNGQCAGTAVLTNYLVSPSRGVINAFNASSTGMDAHFPHVVSGVGSGGSYTTIVGAASLTSTDQLITFTFMPVSGSPQSVTRTLPGNGAIRDSIQNLFGFSSQSFVEGWVRVSGGAPFAAFAAYGDTMKGGLAIVPVQEAPRDTMLFAHIADLPPWSVGLALLNTGSVDATIEVYAMNPSGTLIGGADNVPTARFTLRPGTKRSALLSALIPQTQQRTADGGFIFIRSSVPLFGMELFFTRDLAILAHVAPSEVAQGITFTPPLPSAIRVNEVESNGGTPGDWVEIVNTGSTPVDVSGWRFLDNDDTHVAYVLPAGSTIAAGGYLVLEEAAFGFGLGGADSARLFDATATLVDSYAWTAHAATTYARCPNGTGAFVTSTSVTKGAANDCRVNPVTTVSINEVESNGGTPGDWVEIINTGSTPVDVSGWRFLDNDDTHVAYVLPAGSTIAAGGYLVLEEAAFGFGLGAPDSARLFDSTGAPYESYSWTAHATTTYGRCPNGMGSFTTSASSTKGGANACGSTVKINEIESDGGVPGDWVELHNPGGSAIDISGFVFRDNDDTHTYSIPAGTSVAAGGYYLLEEAAVGFGLGGADSVRLFDTTAALVDSYTWTAHATTTYGRCPNSTGAFTTTVSSTKGTANACPGEVSALPWPGDAEVQTADGLNVFGGNLSGLMYEGSGSAAPGVLWAVRNGPGSLFRLVWDGTIFTPDAGNNWGAGKLLLYPGGAGSPDSEGVTFAGANSAGGMYVATERDNNANSVSRNSILRFDASAAGATLTATHEWNLTADLPSVGPNLGMEAITWIPDTFLTSAGFFDESKSHAYNPAEYPDHGAGLFFVGLEANGMIYAYALNQSGSGFTRVATIASGFAGVMDIRFDRDTNDLWALCDDTCLGRSAVLRINAGGRFAVQSVFERPGLMPNLNNEGFAVAPVTECVGNRRPAFWADDSETDGHSIRRGNVTCTTPSMSTFVLNR